MRRYYFDVRNGDHFGPDSDGQEFGSIGEAEREAALSLAEWSRDVVKRPGQSNGRLAIEVRDDDGPVLRARLTVEIERYDRQ